MLVPICQLLHYSHLEKKNGPDPPGQKMKENTRNLGEKVVHNIDGTGYVLNSNSLLNNIGQQTGCKKCDLSTKAKLYQF